MIHADERFVAAIEAAVTEVEHGTDAEIVVVASPRSGSYRDVALLAGMAVGAVTLGVAAWSPWHFSPDWIPLDVAIAVALGTWLTARSPRLLRLFAPAARQRAQVLSAAHAIFHEEQVHATRERTGILIYVSALEETVEVVPDHGIDARVPHAEWNAIDWHAHDLDEFLAGLKACGAMLARLCPARDDNPDEIHNTPRIRP